MKARLLALLLGMVAALAVIELGLAALGAVYTRRYAPRPPLGAGPTTVLCIGDSFTLGIGAPPGQSYPDQLASLLNAGGPKYRVVNAGRAVANTAMARAIFTEQSARFQPRFVALMIGPANYWNLTGYDAPERSGLGAVLGGACRRIRILKLIRLLRHQWSRPVQPGFRSEPCAGSPRGSEVLWSPDGARKDPLESMLLSGEAPDAVLRAGRLRMKASPKDPKVPVIMGKALLISGRISEAETLFHKAAALAPGDARLTFEIASAYLRAQPHRHEGRLWAMRGKALDEDAPDFPLLMLYSHRLAAEAAAAKARSWLEEVRARQKLGKRLRYWRVLGEDSSDAALEGAVRFIGAPSRGPDPAAWTRADITAIARECRSRGITLILMSYPNPTRFEDYQTIAEQEGVEFLDNKAMFDRLRREGIADAFFSPDHHCNAAGYGLISRALAKRIASLSGQ